MKMLNKIMLVFISLLMISSCSSDSEKNNMENKVVEDKIWEEFTISALGNTMMDMEYNIKAINVNEGSWIRIILKNEGIDMAMIHNILFVNFGKRKEVALKANKAGADKDYIPNHPEVIKGSGLAQPGETVTVEFKAPPKGTYEYFCSYPGHAEKMKGYLHVK